MGVAGSSRVVVGSRVGVAVGTSFVYRLVVVWRAWAVVLRVGSWVVRLVGGLARVRRRCESIVVGARR